MPKFSIECEQSLGMAHFGGEVIANGEGTVELSDEEVKCLVELIREKNATDVDELELDQRYPELYQKLDKAYHDMARRAEEMHWLWEGFYDGVYEYDLDDVMTYCEDECGYEYEPSDGVITDEEDEDYDEDALFEDKAEVFNEWLDGYLSGLSDEDACAFFYDQLNAGVDLDDVEYEVRIPAAIIEMAREG